MKNTKQMSKRRAFKRGSIVLNPIYKEVDGERIIVDHKMARKTKRGRIVYI